ncbi:uncharacterized protein LOC101203762 isoform X2 [Cucumis sativus]|uniref:Survival motor neuron Tudor domain-containing protein n=1 Tax=Cucumis sativus TaxID=3659 RepID=A0A0A0L6D7_CUCSA|nr:uncharacterized protein LOC101203762 isoform X2 [Cucumis sativus]KGN55721.1 hypothetical protein Csa_010161 [Cucumis sativus]
MGLDKMYWDDSMIVKAMDEAMWKYKIMHGHEVPRVSSEGGGVVNGCGKSDELKRSVDEESYIGENNVEFGVEETTSTLEAKENIGVEPSMACTDFSDALHVEVEETQEEPVEDSNLNLKGEEYNRLLKQYYELEEKRQKILEQLYQCGAGGWNYQNVNAGSNVGTQWGAYAANQEHPVSASQPSYYPAMPSYLPTSYPIVVGPQSTSLDDGDIIKTAMDSATRAISSSMETVNKGKESDRDDGIMRRSGDSSQTDLATVLNAWYSAGFHTGKYLMEQSHAKN